MPLLDEMLDAEDLSEFVKTDQIASAVSTEPISTLKPKTPLTLTPDATLDQAIAFMQNKRIGAVLVVENGNLVGIFTERDVLFKVVNQGLVTNQETLRHIMTPNPETLKADDKIAYALNRMTVGGYRHIPIVDGHGHLTGIISVKDIVEFLVSLVEAEVYNVRPEPLREGFSHLDGG